MVSKAFLSVETASASWSRLPHLKARLEKAAGVTLAHLPKHLQFPVSITLLLTTDASIRRLNHDFRGMDKPTNVLSFPQYEPASLRRLRGSKQTVELGDIALGYQYIVCEAKKDHKILINHVTHLFIHGLLHLFGYDHIHDPEAGKMEGLETKIMAALDLPDPYAPAQIMEPKRRRKAARKRSFVLPPKK